ncbi:SAM-dependent methyltransferase, MidA [hydrothermal vent metagenome]|uniref:SAM-dependent methyltransferase, MidA n=1 Tax=hydrothermal vent metagenome TaxID=652676 RepID=A0A3B0WDL5_9ZZZZ
MIKTDGHALAEPDDKAKKRSQLLVQSIKEKCDLTGGNIRFSEYMNAALYQPGLGYYSGGLQKFGSKGDFITAPEVSPFFGQCLATQIAEIFQNFKNHADKNLADENLYVLEFGAGSGILAVDILLQLEKLAMLPEKYLILELSAELQNRQQETIQQKAPHLFERVSWLNQLPDDVKNAVVVANEVLDAMPVECFKVNGNEVETLMVASESEKLTAYYIADNTANEKIKSIQERSEIKLADAYCSEFNPAIQGWLSALEDKIQRMVILLIDYGYNEKEYYHPDRTAGTLMCYYRHKAHSDFFWWPGLQDITAFVNFTDVAYSATDSKLEVAGYTTQAAFLLGNGLSDLHAAQVTDDVQQQVKLSQQIKTLTLPSEMGDRFKVMALTKNYEEALKGFSMLDLRNRL